MHVLPAGATPIIPLYSAHAGEGLPGIRHAALGVLGAEPCLVSRDCRRLFEALFVDDPYAIATVRALARWFGTEPTTLTTRFSRARLPNPKRYLAYAWLVRATDLFRTWQLPLKKGATALGYASVQSFDRHVGMLLQCSAEEFAAYYDSERMLTRFRQDLVEPYRAALHHLRFPRQARSQTRPGPVVVHAS